MAFGSKTPPSARNAAMNLLARREHSRLELRRKLQKRFERCDLDRAIDRLTEEGLQSDERFSESFTRERMLRGQGPLRIAAELRGRGVSDSLISCALARVPDEEGTTWNRLAREALERKFGAEAPQDIQERARQARFLAYRGFGHGNPLGDSD